jgi:excinuclease UvrABC helicase subunit UvrB
MKYKNYQVAVLGHGGEYWVSLYDYEQNEHFIREVSEDDPIDKLEPILKELEQEAEAYKNRPIELDPVIPF